LVVAPARKNNIAKIDEIRGEPTGRGGRLRSGHERQLGIADRWKSMLRPERVMVAEDRDLRQNANAETGGDRSLDAGQARAGVGDVPSALRRFDGMDCAISVETALLENNERHRITAHVDRTAAACDPVQALWPRGDAAAFPNVAFQECEIELAAFQIVARSHTEIAAHVEPEIRV